MKFVDHIDEAVYNYDLHDDFETHVGDVNELLRLESELELDEMIENTK